MFSQVTSHPNADQRSAILPSNNDPGGNAAPFTYKRDPFGDDDVVVVQS